ncbi:ankyrin repeat-containing domain protein [Rostrohypoxylon terebratum]|nr:ankyrin repeat-containing domain protein [Rostrohypoxylon terebratum]
MLAVSLIDELDRRIKDIKKQEPSKHVLAYFFCDHQVMERSHAAYVIRSLLWQVLSNFPELATPLCRKFEKQKSEGLFSTSDSALYLLLSVLKETCVDPKLRVYLVIDALDECSEGSRDILLKYLGSTQNQLRIKWLITVRNDVELWGGALAVSLEDNKRFVDGAVDQYVSKKVQELASVKHYDDELRASVDKHLRQTADGTFLWVSLVCKELAKPKVKSVNTMRILSELPRGLAPLYRRILEQVLDNREFPEHVVYAIRILQAVLVAFRPLSLKELAIAAGLPKNYQDRERWIQECVESCGSFVSVQEGTGHVILIHRSVEDYLTPKHCSHPRECKLAAMYCRTPDVCRCSTKCLTPKLYPSKDKYPENFYSVSTASLIFPAEASKLHLDMSYRCIEYVKCQVFPRVFVSSTQDAQQTRKSFVTSICELPMTSYALLYFGLHVATSHQVERAWFSMHMAQFHQFFCQWLDCMEWLQDPKEFTSGNYKSAQIEALRIFGSTGALAIDQEALELWKVTGDTSIVFIMLVEVDNEAIMEIMIRKMADAITSERCSRGKTALHYAVEYGNEVMARTLIQAGADVNSQDMRGKTPLRQAIDNNDIMMASLLIRSGASVSIADERGHTLLHIAEDEDRGAKEQTRDRSIETAGNYELIVQLLIDSGADVNATDKDRWTSLHWAADKNKESMARRLLKNSSDPNLADKFGRTALHWAAQKGYIGMTSLLLEGGANANALDSFSGVTALHLAIHKRHKDVVLLLLKNHADPNTHLKTTREMPKIDSRLYLKPPFCHLEILLEKDYDKTQSVVTAGFLLHWANMEMATLLLDNGANLNIQETKFNTSPLTCAVMRLDRDVMELFLQKGADPNLKDVLGRTALFYAQKLWEFEMLVEYGADVNAADLYGATLLHISARFLKPERVKLLLNKGANPLAKDRGGMTPLQQLELGMLEIEEQDSELSRDDDSKNGSNTGQLKLAFEEIKEILEVSMEGDTIHTYKTAKE